MNNFIKYYSALFIVISSLFISHYASAAPLIITMAGLQTNFNEYESLIAEHGKESLFKKGLPYDSPTNRVVSEMIIIMRALKEGGLDAKIEYLSVPNARRETLEVSNGHAVICSQQFNKATLQEDNFSETLLITDAITRLGEFEKGIYHLPDNHAFLNATNTREIKSFGTAIIGLHWNNDERVLSKMKVNKIIHAPTYKSMFSMLKVGRGEWIPLEFPNTSDLSITAYGVKVVPVHGVKFSLLESRHFLVSKNHHHGQKVFDALQIGIKKLRKEGYIRKVLEQSGFFSTKTKSWRLLNEDQITNYKHTY
ncbi:hypothetical protein [Maridesulfovibrio frigidus]|uniref:hypothetical protein n=1 Tax=Maridesulfovibrio frigidus TaxID=340956 RepID=UPI0004E27B75|nr:hypothetical protein [Maridesulfovibrio frigidus]